MNRVYYAAQRGFTLVELLIVVIILALLAAIVVPQFASSTDDAKISSLDTTLSNMRGAIDLYYQQHGEYPGANDATTEAIAACTGTQGTGNATDAANRDQAFRDQMSMYTDTNGGACSIKDGTFKYGPYLKKSDLPNNPVTGVGTFVVENTGDLDMIGDGADGGWKYDVLTGKFIANDTNADPSGLTYDKH